MAGHRSKLAHDSGVPEADLRALSQWRESQRFDQVDRLVLEYAEAMTRTPVEVADELFERLRERFDERQLVELTISIGLENLYSRSNWAFGIEGEGFSDGMYCVPADRAAGENACERGRRALASFSVAKRGNLRASDADREQIVDRLRTAAAEGRLAAPELEHRVTTALKARTYGELDETVADLPGTQVSGRRPSATWAVSTVRTHPALLLVAIPIAALAVATLVAITVLWSAVMLVALVLGHRGRIGPGPWMYGGRRRYVSARRADGPPRSHWA